MKSFHGFVYNNTRNVWIFATTQFAPARFFFAYFTRVTGSEKMQKNQNFSGDEKRETEMSGGAKI